MQYLRLCQSGADGMCHSCHTLDTPLVPVKSGLTFWYDILGRVDASRHTERSTT